MLLCVEILEFQVASILSYLTIRRNFAYLLSKYESSVFSEDRKFTETSCCRDLFLKSRKFTKTSCCRDLHFIYGHCFSQEYWCLLSEFLSYTMLSDIIYFWMQVLFCYMLFDQKDTLTLSFSFKFSI